VVPVTFAEIAAMAGAHDVALDKLDWLLSVPSTVSVGILRASPIRDPLRDHPGFQALME
jgi:hypothetical protein